MPLKRLASAVSLPLPLRGWFIRRLWRTAKSASTFHAGDRMPAALTVALMSAAGRSPNSDGSNRLALAVALNAWSPSRFMLPLAVTLPRPARSVASRSVATLFSSVARALRRRPASTRFASSVWRVASLVIAISPLIAVGFMAEWTSLRLKRSVCSAKRAVPMPSSSLVRCTPPVPVNLPAAPKSSSTFETSSAVRLPPSWPRAARSGRRCWSIVPSGPVLVMSTLPLILRFSSSLPATAKVRSAVGRAGLKKPGSTLRPLMRSARSGMSAYGAIVKWASPMARPAWPVASICVAFSMSPPTLSCSCAARAPALACDCVRLPEASILKGRAAPTVALAATWPHGVVAAAFCTTQLRLSPLARRRILSMRVSAPAMLTIVMFATRPSSTSTRNGGARLVGSTDGSSVSLSVCMRTLAAHSLSINTPPESTCAGDQSMSILLAVMTCSSVRQIRRSMCIEPYSEPLTPVSVSLPPVALATRWAIICSVVSRPRYHSVPPTMTPVATRPIATRRGQRRGLSNWA